MFLPAINFLFTIPNILFLTLISTALSNLKLINVEI